MSGGQAGTYERIAELLRADAEAYARRAALVVERPELGRYASAVAAHTQDVLMYLALWLAEKAAEAEELSGGYEACAEHARSVARLGHAPLT